MFLGNVEAVVVDPAAQEGELPQRAFLQQKCSLVLLE